MSSQHGFSGQVMMMADGHMMHMKAANSYANSFDNLGAELLMTSREALHHRYSLHDHLGNGGNWTETLLNEAKYAEQNMEIFWTAPQFECFTLFLAVTVLICLESFIAKRLNIGSYKSHITMVCFWVFCGLAYNVLYATRHGGRDGIDWFIGYVLEWMLSLDNLFAFQFIMRVYSAPPAIQQKALIFGVVGAMVWRLLMFGAIGYLMHSIHYIQFIFGFILIYAGVQTIHGDDEDQDPNELLFVRMLKHVLGDRLQDSYDMSENHALFVWHPETGRLSATLLVPLIFCIQISDLIFAVDSVSAKVAQIPNQYIAYSSSVLAMLGLRAMYFVVDDLVSYFETLKYGVCFILVFIGGELMISGKYQLPDWIVCIVILSVFNFCIVLSILQKVIWPTPVATPESKNTVAEAAAGAEEGQATESKASSSDAPLAPDKNWKGASGQAKPWTRPESLQSVPRARLAQADSAGG